jgi:protein SCO1/2
MRPFAFALALSVPLTALAAGRPIAPDVSIDQKLGSELPGALRFRDASGRGVSFSSVLGGRPIVLDFVYFRCPMLCSYVLNGTLRAMRAMSLSAGRDFDLVVVSIDPSDRPNIAAAREADFVRQYGRPAAGGIHFLTGEEPNIRALADASGFRYERDSETKEFSHAAGMMVATADGRMSHYFYGVEFSPSDLRLALVAASNGRIGNPVDRFLLLCSHYDPATGKYSLAVMRVVRILGIATVVLLGGFLIVMFRKDASRRGGVGRAA